MKLVNPVGREVDVITNQANYGCYCSDTGDVNSYIWNNNDIFDYPGGCSCGCAYGTANNRGYRK